MDRTHYILAGGLLDGSGGRARHRVFLEIRGGVIQAIGPATDLPGNAAKSTTDLSHCLILPPLFDCSVLLASSPSLSDGKGQPAANHDLGRRHLGYLRDHGVLGLAVNDRPPIPAETTFPAMRLRLNGRDFIKIIYTSDIEEGEESPHKVSHAELKRIIRDKGERKAVVVANGREAVEEAILAGAEAIEQGYRMGKDNLREMAAKKIIWIPCLIRAKNGLDSSACGGSVCCRFSMRYAAPGKSQPETETQWKKLLTDQLAQLELARRLGVITAVGTGAGNPGIIHGESVSEEIKLFLRASFSIEEAVRAASTSGAGFFNPEATGLIAPGERATFLVVRGTLKQLPRKLAYLEAVYFEGRSLGKETNQGR